MANLKLPKLKFNKNLAGLNTKDILKELKSLHEELSRIEQEKIDLASLNKSKEQLISTSLLNSKDHGVRLYCASCLADLLRLYAPDAPYSLESLKDIFLFFVKTIMQYPKDSEYDTIYHYLLENLVQVQCIALVAELPGSEQVIEHVFGSLFQLLNTDSVGSSTAYLLTSLLSQIIVEAEILPLPTIKLVLSQFLNPHAGVAYQASKDLCIEHPNLMTRMVGQYFAEIFSRYPAHGDDDEYEEDEDFERELNAMNRLFVELWSAAPEILSNEIGRLEQYLSVENLSLRSVATLTIGQILAHSPSRVNFIQTQHSAYVSWTGRMRDKEAHIRSTWVSCAGPILANRPDTPPDITRGVVELLQDPEDEVRLEACTTLSAVDSIESFLNINLHLQKSLMSALCDRLRDRKSSVRIASSNILADLYNKAYDEIESGTNQPAISMFSQIPSHFLELVYINDIEINQQVDHILFTKILPEQCTDIDARTRRLLVFARYLSEEATKVAENFCKRQAQINQALRLFLADVQNNSLDTYSKQSKISSWATWISKQVSNPERARNIITWFAESGDGPLYKSFSICIDPSSVYTDVSSAIGHFRNRLRELKKEYAISTLETLLFRGGFFLLNESSAYKILALSQEGADPLSATAQVVSQYVAAYQPKLLSNHLERLEPWLRSLDSNMRSRYEVLKIANIIWQSHPELSGQSNELWELVKNIAITGNVKEAAEATKLLRFSPDKNQHFSDLFLVIKDVLLDSPNFSRQLKLSTALSILVQLYQNIPSVVEEHAGSIMLNLVDNVIMAEDTEDTGDIAGESLLWSDFEDTKEIDLAKIMVLRVLVSRLVAVHADVPTATVLLSPVISLIRYFISFNNDEKQVEAREGKSKLRLEAGLSVIQLCKIPTFDKLLGADIFVSMASLIQDPVMQVREGMVHKIAEELLEEEISVSRFYPLMFFSALEEDPKLRQFSSTWIRAKNQRLSAKLEDEIALHESSFARFLVYLVHVKFSNVLQTDANESGNQYYKSRHLLETACSFILYYLSLAATERNTSIFYYVASRMKLFRDKIAETEDIDEGNSSTELYVMSELAQICISQLQQHKSWKSETYSGHAGLPKDCFAPFSLPERMNGNAKRQFIFGQLLTDIQVFVKKQLPKYAFSRKEVTTLARTRNALGEVSSNEFPRKFHKSKQRMGSIYSAEKSENEEGEEESSEEAFTTPQKRSAQHPSEATRRSNRQKTVITYNEIESDTEMV